MIVVEVELDDMAYPLAAGDATPLTTIMALP